MAEVVGVVSAGVGIAAFALQVTKSVNKLRATLQFNKSKAVRELTPLSQHLEILQQTLSNLRDAGVDCHPTVNLIIGTCSAAYAEIDGATERLSAKLQNQATSKGHSLKSIRFALSTEVKDDIAQIQSKLSTIIPLISLAFHTVQLQEHQTQTSQKAAAATAEALAPAAAAEAPLISGPAFTPERGLSVDPNTETDTAIQSANAPGYTHANLEPGGQIKSTALSRSFFRQNAVACSVRRCHCSCHLTTQASGRLWSLDYTPLAVLSRKCNSTHCSSRGGRWYLRVCLSKYGIPWAVLGGLDFISDAGGYAIRPALQMQRVVKYTSPGFETLWRLRHGLVALPDAVSRLTDLYRSDPKSFIQHVDPSGYGYIQKLLRGGPWPNQNNQFCLLKHFACEFGISLGEEDQRFLTSCARWIGEGRHLDLLDLILSCGFDPGTIDSPLSEQWPHPCSPDWKCEEITPDPFFIEYLATIARNNRGFTGLTSLQEAILCGPLEAVGDCLRCSRPLEQNVNFLGQTPLHLAASNIDATRLLLEAGHELDKTDQWGTTPLMYAAAMGCLEVTLLLISQGANPVLRDDRLGRTFLHYALARHHVNLIVPALESLRLLYGESILQCFVQCALVKMLGRYAVLRRAKEREALFERLVHLCDNVNFTFDDNFDGTTGNTMMHFVQSINEAQVLVERGYDSFNQPNSAGKLPMNTLTECTNAKLIELCLVKGTDVNHKNENHCTVLFSLLEELESATWLVWDVMDSIRACMAAGADIFAGDECKCPCAPNGCVPVSVFSLGFGSGYWQLFHGPDFVWALEWLLLVEDYRGNEESKKVLLSVFRRLKAEEIDLSHVCCHRGRWTKYYRFEKCPLPLEEEDIREILDEEVDFIEILEDDMRQLEARGASSLRVQWIHAMHDRYKAHVKKVQADEKRTSRKEEKKALASTYGVDYDRDEYHINYSVSLREPNPNPVAKSMASYALWLEHDLRRAQIAAFCSETRNGWYEKRVLWLTKLMEIFEITGVEIAEKMTGLSVHESRTEKVDVASCARHFLESISRERQSS